MIPTRYAFDIDSIAEKSNCISLSECDSVFEALHNEQIGVNHEFTSPFGKRKTVYADWTATGRALKSIEDYIQNNVLPDYGNTHSLTTRTAKQSTFFKHESKQIIKQVYNATHDDSLIFTSNGSTSALEKYLTIMKESDWGRENDGVSVSIVDRWGGVTCGICDGVRFKDEGEFRSHILTDIHIKRAEEKKIEKAKMSENNGTQLVALFCDPTAHHSLMLPLRMLEERSRSMEKDAKENNRCQPKTIYRTFLLPYDKKTGLVDVEKTQRLMELFSLLFINNGVKGNLSTQFVKFIPAVFLSYVSNVTGLQNDVYGLSSTVRSLHKNAIILWDLASSCSHHIVDINPALHPTSFADAVVFSTHKMLGGVGGSGVLILKRRFQMNASPSFAGGGTVFYVSEASHKFIMEGEEREEAGTPDLLGVVRASLANRMLSMIPEAAIRQRELNFYKALLEGCRQEKTIRVLGSPYISSDLPKSLSSPTLSLCIRFGSTLLHHNFLATLLNDIFGIQSRSGCMCAGPYAQQLLGMSSTQTKDYEKVLIETGNEVLRPGFLRISLHYSMTENEVLYIRSAVRYIAQYAWIFLPLYSFKVNTGEFFHRNDNMKQERLWLSHYCLPGTTTGKVVVTNPYDATKSQKHEAKVLNHIFFPSFVNEFNNELARVKMCENTAAEGIAIIMDKYLKDKVSETVYSHLQNGAFEAASVSSTRTPPLAKASEERRWFTLPSEAAVELEDFLSSKKAITLSLFKERINQVNGTRAYEFARILEEEKDKRRQDAVKGGRADFYDPELSSDSLVGVHEESLLTEIQDLASSLLHNPSTSTPSLPPASLKRKLEDNLSSVFESFLKRQNSSPSHSTAPQIPITVDTEAISLPATTQANNATASTAAAPLAKPKKMVIPSKLRSKIGQAIQDFSMIQEGDSLLVGLSGGKDSLSLLHILHEFQKKSKVNFTIAAATVDPMTVEYNPSTLIPYMKQHNIQYHLLQLPIMKLASQKMNAKQSICSFCSRMKRGLLYSCMRKHNYNVLVLGQHLDDIAESFLMSLFFNGTLNTMKAHYTASMGDIRVIRPLIYCREYLTDEFAKTNALPIVADNCPACFAAPKERHRVKTMLSSLEHEHPHVFQNMLQGVRGLIGRSEAGTSGISATSDRTRVRDEMAELEEMVGEKEEFKLKEVIVGFPNGNGKARGGIAAVQGNSAITPAETHPNVSESMEDLDFAAEMSVTPCGVNGCSWKAKK